MSVDGPGTKCRRNIAENLNRLSRAHERYRQTDGRAIAYSERERKFTFAKDEKVRCWKKCSLHGVGNILGSETLDTLQFIVHVFCHYYLPSGFMGYEFILSMKDKG